MFPSSRVGPRRWGGSTSQATWHEISGLLPKSPFKTSLWGRCLDRDFGCLLCEDDAISENRDTSQRRQILAVAAGGTNQAM
jgi:hypothetical protein